MSLRGLLGDPQQRRWEQASKVKELVDVEIPRLDVWNYDACEYHDYPRPDCEFRACGGPPFPHQNITSTFSYLSQKSMVANNTGTGKTISALETLALVHHGGEEVRAIVVCPTTAVGQWTREANRWTPGFRIATIPSGMPKKKRMEIYSSQWNVLIIGYHVLARDAEHIYQIQAPQVVVDDVDPVLNTSNKTHQAMFKICDIAEYVIVQNATSLASHLLQLYAASILIGAKSVWGSKTAFMKQYLQREMQTVYVKPKKLKSGKMSSNKRKVFTTVGYKDLRDFKRKFDPMSIRFTYEDLEGDQNIPDIITQQVYLEMSPKQRNRYTELQDGVRIILDDKGMPASKKAANALTMFTIGSQICSGTFALKTSDGGHEPDGPEASPKLDWIMGKLEDEWRSEKVVVYAKFQGAIMALQDRLSKEGIGYSTIWGKDTDPKSREEEMTRFWEDPSTRVMIISVSGERSLNLQNASVLVMWDLQLNPARVTQLAGRVRRLGSTNKRVYVFQLLHSDSQEENYMTRLSTRQALFDYVYDVEHDEDDIDTMLIQQLPAELLLELIKP